MIGNVIAVLVFLAIVGVLVFGVDVHSLATAWDAVQAGFGGVVDVVDG